ncbi:MAG: hypothetical protein COV47_01635 [Candidatus Diapherotrites archaeon CG11_big_fil_rev_8_21_14_0_20_37_9]|nr:MAG: hypothetical protein COV47_01635 [Candidatus Diapherotrites archaeon CG11_big_fil_rev_8_21_14_0_20_37_9]
MVSWTKNIWDLLITLSLLIIVITLITEFFIHLDKDTMELLHTTEIFALSFLFMELAHDFYLAEDKKKFVAKEWLRIISFIPFATVFRFALFARTTKVMQFLGSLWLRVKVFLRIESVTAKTGQSVVHASKATRIMRPVAQFFSKKEEYVENARKKKKRN